MYHKEKSLQIKNSASALFNNLGVLRIAPKQLTYFTVVHANVVNMVSASWDGLNYSHRQLQSKEPNVATSTSLIMQMDEDRRDVLRLVESDDEQIFQDCVPHLSPLTNGGHTTLVQMHQIPSSDHEDAENAETNQSNWRTQESLSIRS